MIITLKVVFVVVIMILEVIAQIALCASELF